MFLVYRVVAGIKQYIAVQNLQIIWTDSRRAAYRFASEDNAETIARSYDAIVEKE